MGSTTLSSALGTDMGSPPFTKAGGWLLPAERQQDHHATLQGRSFPASPGWWKGSPRPVEGESRELQAHPTSRGLGGNRECVALEQPSSWQDSACKDLVAFPACSLE